MEAIKRSFWVSFLFLRLSTESAVCHPMPSSMVRLTILNEEVSGHALIPMRDLRSVLGERTSLQELKNYFIAHSRPESLNGKMWDVEITEAMIVESTHLASGDYTELSVSFRMIPPPLESLTDFIFDYDVVCHQVVTHQVFVLVEHGKIQTAATIELDIPTEKIKPLEIRITKNNSSDNPSSSISKVILSGIAIASILILITLRIPSFRRNLKV